MKIAATGFVNLSNQHGGIIRVDFEAGHLLTVHRVVQLREAVITEQAGALWRHLVADSHPQRREYVAHETLSAFSDVFREDFWVV